jgi:hypothetical protein
MPVVFRVLGWSEQLRRAAAQTGNVQISQVVGDLFGRAAFDRDVVIRGHRSQFGDVADVVAFSFTVGDCFEGEGHIAPVVGVGRRTGGNRADQVAGLDGVNGRPADAR